MASYSPPARPPFFIPDLQVARLEITDALTGVALGGASAENVGEGGGELFSGVGPGGVLQFRTLAPGPGVALATAGGTVTILAGASGANLGASGEGRVGLYSGAPAGVLQFRSLEAGPGVALAVVGEGEAVSIEAAASGENLGGGRPGRVGIYADSAAGVLRFRSLEPGQGVVISPLDGGSALALSVQPVIGEGASAGSGGVAFGGGAAAGFRGSAFGDASSAGFLATALGRDALAGGDNSTAAGGLSRATGLGGSAFGLGAEAAGDKSTALGFYSAASGELALSAGGFARGLASLALGRNSSADGLHSCAVGTNAAAATDFSAAYGFGARALGGRALSAGQGALAAGDDSAALGPGAVCRVPGAAALCGPQCLRRTEGGADPGFSAGAGSTVLFSSGVVALMVEGTYTLPIPSSAVFYPTALSVLEIFGDSSSAPGAFSAGDSGDPGCFLVGGAADGRSRRFSVLSAFRGTNSPTITLTSLAGFPSACRFVWEGILVEREAAEP